MSRTMMVKAGLASAALCGLTLGILDCSHRGSGVGDVQLELKVSSTSDIKTVDYVVSGNGITPVTGSIDVSKFNVTNGLVSGIRAGKRYSVELSATSTDGAVTCAGDTVVDIAEGKTAQANIVMQCSDTKGRGVVSITGTFDNCPIVASYTAAPLSAPLNGTIGLQVRGVDSDGDPLTFEWKQSPRIGTLGDVQQVAGSLTASMTFFCTMAGTTTLSVSASDGTCDDTAEIPVTCGGSASTGGTSGSGGANPSGSGSGNSPGGTGGTSGGGLQPGSGGTTTGSGATFGGGGVTGTGSMMGMGGMMGSAGMTGMGGGIGAGGAAGCEPTHCAGAACEACSFKTKDSSPLCASLTTDPDALDACGDSPNCTGTDAGCDALPDPADKKLCENLYACYIAHGSECAAEFDPLNCWCGTKVTTCTMSNDPATRANGPCLSQVFAAAKTQDAPAIFALISSPTPNPMQMATDLFICRYNNCRVSCAIPSKP